MSLLGPVISAAGIVWAILQPGRVTLLHPRGQGLWPGAGPRGVLHDLGQSSIEIGDEDYFGRLYSGERRLHPGVRDLIGFLNHPSYKKRGRCRSITDLRGLSFGNESLGKTPNICPPPSGSRAAQKSSAATGSP